MVRVITHESEVKKNLDRRMERVRRLSSEGRLSEAQLEYALATFEKGDIPHAEMGAGFDPRSHLRQASGNGHVAEFTGASAGRFAQGFYTRLRTEVQNGRELVPTLFENIYTVQRSSEIQEVETIYTFGDDNVGVAFKEILPDGNVQWASIGGGEKTIRQRQWARGIEYTKRLIKFGKFFQMAPVERAFGRAANALQNHIHFDPILNPSTAYTTRNQTDGGALSDPFKFRANASMTEKYHRTLGAAMAHARTDETYHRPGPYALLVSESDLPFVRMAIENPAQQGFSLVSADVIDSIRLIIAYRGWSGSDGNENVSYSGVSTGTAYMIDLSQAMFDFQSLYSQDLEMTDVGAEHARFVVERVLWDMWFGIYAAPERAVEKITWPAATDGES
jgi:hypothetical protein